MLQYAYWGTTMPPAAHDALRKQIRTVYDMAANALDKGGALDLEWFYMDAKAVRAIVPKLKFWLDEGPSVCLLSHARDPVAKVLNGFHPLARCVRADFAQEVSYLLPS